MPTRTDSKTLANTLLRVPLLRGCASRMTMPIRAGNPIGQLRTMVTEFAFSMPWRIIEMPVVRPATMAIPNSSLWMSTTGMGAIGGSEGCTYRLTTTLDLTIVGGCYATPITPSRMIVPTHPLFGCPRTSTANYRSRSDCNNVIDDCNGSYSDGVSEVLSNANLGRKNDRLVNCVDSRYSNYPGNECFWTAARFKGWYSDPPSDASGYRDLIDDFMPE